MTHPLPYIQHLLKSVVRLRIWIREWNDPPSSSGQRAVSGRVIVEHSAAIYHDEAVCVLVFSSFLAVSDER